MSEAEKVQHLWMYLGTSPQSKREGVVSVASPHGVKPLITTIEAALPSMRETALEISAEAMITLRLVKVVCAEELEVIDPAAAQAEIAQRPPSVQTIDLPEFDCPSCKAKLSAATYAKVGNGPFQAGCIVVCSECAAYLMAQQDGSHVELTPDQFAELPDVAQAFLKDVSEAVKAMKAEKARAH
ncbi:MAG TPA: hypothetical protein VD867_05330 [Burkholderiales bacterium]|nr:hypothetical protein [Burkholderiales bacterium]